MNDAKRTYELECFQIERNDCHYWTAAFLEKWCERRLGSEPRPHRLATLTVSPTARRLSVPSASLVRFARMTRGSPSRK